MSPSLLTRLLLGVLLLGQLGAGVVFYRRQNRPGRMGGRISKPKLLWLNWAVFVWLILTPLVALDASLSPALRMVFGGFAINMWLRGLVELYMMYVSKNWRPPYGIAHNLFSLVLLAGLLLANRAGLPGLNGGWHSWVLALSLVIWASLVIETVYALGFHRAVAGHTTGDDAVWFAAAGDPKFQRLNRLTVVCNVPLFGFLAAFCGVSLFGGM